MFGEGLGTRSLKVMVLVKNLEKIEVHIVDSHASDHPLRVGEVSVLVVWFGAGMFLFVFLLDPEEFERL